MMLVFCGSVIRGAGDTKSPMLINLFANVANIIGNFLLIFPSRDIQLFGRTWHVWGAGWGVEGAAVSTAFFRCIVRDLFVLSAVFQEFSSGNAA